LKKPDRRPKRHGTVRTGEKVLWIVGAATAAMILFSLVRAARNEISPRAITGPAPGPAQAERVVTREQAEKPPPPRAAPPQAWKVLFATPEAGKEEVSRGADITLFFNGPVEPKVVEWAFTLSPSTPGTFAWPRPDKLVFTPTAGFAPATRHAVSLTPASGFHNRQEYELLEARWAFTTGTTRTYHTDIKPVIAAYCAACHGPGGTAATIPLATYTDISRYVVPGRSKDSPLYTFIQTRQHYINMAGPHHSTRDKLAIIKDWIDGDGAAE